MKNTLLQNQIESILAKGGYCNFGISLEIVSETDSSFYFKPLEVGSVSITENYISSICDEITVSFNLSMKDYIGLYKQQTSLVGNLTFVYRNSLGLSVASYPNIVRKYRILLINPIDIEHQNTNAILRDTLDMTISVQLIEHSVYNTRLKKVNGIFTTDNLENIIKHITREFGINKLQLVSPDNSQVYEHVVIPPYQSFYEFYDYIHKHYGVYMQGITYYVTNDTLYVYPPYDVSPTSDRSLYVYQADEGDYAGVNSMYYAESDTLYLVANKINKSADTATISAENDGTSKSFLKASSLITGAVEISDTTNDVQFKKDVVMNVGLKNANMVAKDSQNENYHSQSTDNVFVLASRLSKSQSQIVSFLWRKAVPFSTTPGMKVVFTYDNNSTIGTRSGIIDSIDYIFTQSNRTGEGVNFTGTANVVIRLTPTEQSNNSTTTNNNTFNSLITTLTNLF